MSNVIAETRVQSGHLELHDVPFSDDTQVRVIVIPKMDVQTTATPAIKTGGMPAQPQAREFCEKHDLEAAICLARDLIRSSFQNADNLNLQTESDPETGEEWIVIDFTVTGDITQILKEHEQFTRQWTTSAPPDKKGLVRIEFNIL